MCAHEPFLRAAQQPAARQMVESASCLTARWPPLPCFSQSSAWQLLHACHHGGQMISTTPPQTAATLASSGGLIMLARCPVLLAFTILPRYADCNAEAGVPA